MPSTIEEMEERYAAEWRRLDPQLRAVLAEIYVLGEGLPKLGELTPVAARRQNRGMSPFHNRGAPLLPGVEERSIPGPAGPIRLRLYDPGTPAPAPAVVYFHGGGWVLCDLDTHDCGCREIAKRSGLRVVSVEYRLAPEHPFPAALDDCLAAVRWLARNGGKLGLDPARLAISGDSAGGNLALAACLALRDAGEPLLRGAVLIYGALSAEHDTPSHRDFGGGAHFLSTADMDWFWGHYVADPARLRDPLAAPLYADLSGLPPLYVAASECDCLLDDSERLAQRLAAEGRPHEYRLWRGMTHASLHWTPRIDAMQAEVDLMGAFLRRVTAAG